MSDPRQVNLLLKTFYTGRRERLTPEEQQAIADIALRSESTLQTEVYECRICLLAKSVVSLWRDTIKGNW